MSGISDKKIVIVGAGISGLVAAIELEQHGYAPIIIEQSSRCGGRVKTDAWHDAYLDHGFQVLLTAYPAVQSYLDIDALQARQFLPGAVVFKNRQQYTFGDPLRHVSFLLPTLFSPLGSLLDKWKVFRLSQFVKRQTVEQLFATQDLSTLSYLKNYGFSDVIIRNFFKPFYSGIFLEPDLQTSCRMFLFVFKMFAQGAATLPKLGIQAVPTQLAAQLQRTTFMYNTTVAAIEHNTILLADKTSITADGIIVASGANQIAEKNANTIAWNACTNLYFTCAANTLAKPIIGLVADEFALINNIYFIESETPIVSVTVVKKHTYTEAQLVPAIQKELKQYCNIEAIECIKIFNISHALPSRVSTNYLPSIADMTINNFTFLAGDYLANGSLNAAMLSGEMAGNCLHASLEKNADK
jgi:protoporphyrinogen oxidase